TEIIAGVLLVMGLLSRAAATIIFLLVGGFVLLVMHALKQEHTVICGCFGDLKLFCKAEITNCNLIQNGILALLTLIPLVIGGGRASADALLRPKYEPNYDDYGQEDDEVFD
ncbi:MAG: MauE/DoxX family redox-associated membrane protein, partial [Phycisphaerales bacterium JB061]